MMGSQLTLVFLAQRRQFARGISRSVHDEFGDLSKIQASTIPVVPTWKNCLSVARNANSRCKSEPLQQEKSSTVPSAAHKLLSKRRRIRRLLPPPQFPLSLWVLSQSKRIWSRRRLQPIRHQLRIRFINLRCLSIHRTIHLLTSNKRPCLGCNQRFRTPNQRKNRAVECGSLVRFLPRSPSWS